jgi:hypothetical protein
MDELRRVFMNEARCKASRACARLDVREYFFEPNPATMDRWVQRNGLYRDGLDRRVVFVCESPSQVNKAGSPDFHVEGIDGYTCWAGYNPRTAPFLEVRKQFGLENCMITNAVKCGVPRPSTPSRLTESECGACAPFLARELEAVHPRIVACVGGATRNVFDRQTLARLSFRPMVATITHYSFRGSRQDLQSRWQSEFREIAAELQRSGATYSY